MIAPGKMKPAMGPENREASRRSSSWTAVALLSQITLAAYLQVIEWIPLGRWNNVANGNGQGELDIVMAALQLAILVAFWFRWRWLMAVGTLAYVCWGWLELDTWWVPYFRGASPQWMRVYNRWFSHTYKFLPPIGNHPTPDSEHTVLTALIILVVLAGIKATADRFARTAASA
jgi:hypothetical protein